MTLLSFEAVTKRYGQATVLSDVTFGVQPGEVLALCGENGAGKSTLMNILAGAIPHDAYEGRVTLAGDELRLSAPADAERHGIAMLPQELLFYPDLSVAENVMAAALPAHAGVVDRGEMRRRARELCLEVGLDVAVHQPVRRLERSEQQLVCVARALALQPKVLVLDEPTAALPRPAAQRLFGVVRTLVETGARSVVYISHNLGELAGLADRVAVLRNGRLVQPPVPTPPVPAIVAAMLGEAAEELARTSRHGASAGQPALTVRVRRLRTTVRDLLSDVELSVARGEVVGVAGLTGSGREDLLRVAVGERRGRLDGQVLRNGDAQRRWCPRRARERGVFFLTDERRQEGILPMMPAAANALLGSESLASVLGIRRPRREATRLATALEAVTVLPKDRGKDVALLSGGNQQKVLFARPLLQGSQVLLLNEPTRGIDIGARLAVHRLIDRFAAEGNAVVVSSADSAELATLCDRVLVLNRGVLVAELAGAELTEALITQAVTADLHHPTRTPGNRSAGGLAPITT